MRLVLKLGFLILFLLLVFLLFPSRASADRVSYIWYPGASVPDVQTDIDCYSLNFAPEAAFYCVYYENLPPPIPAKPPPSTEVPYTYDSCGQTTSTSDVTACSINNVNYSNTCCTAGGGCWSNYSQTTIPQWGFEYASGCTITGSQVDPTRCSYSYSYQTQVCAGTDSCLATPYLYAGQCNTACTGQTSCTGQQACQVAGKYKACCYGNGTGLDQSCTGGDFSGGCPSGTETVMCGVTTQDCVNVCGGDGCYDSAHDTWCTTKACGTDNASAQACTIFTPTPPPSFSVDVKANGSDCQGAGCGVNNGSDITYRVTVTNSGGPGGPQVVGNYNESYCGWVGWTSNGWSLSSSPGLNYSATHAPLAQGETSWFEINCQTRSMTPGTSFDHNTWVTGGATDWARLYSLAGPTPTPTITPTPTPTPTTLPTPTPTITPTPAPACTPPTLFGNTYCQPPNQNGQPKVGLSWTQVANNTSYVLRRYTYQGGAWSTNFLDKSLAQNTTSYEDSNVSFNTYYTYYVNAYVGGVWCGGWSNQIVVQTPTQASCNDSPPWGTLSVSQMQLKPGDNLTINVTGHDDKDVTTLWAGKSCNSVGCDNNWLPSYNCSGGGDKDCGPISWTTSYSTPGTYQVCGYVYDNHAPTKQGAWTNCVYVTVSTAPTPTPTVAPPPPPGGSSYYLRGRVFVDSNNDGVFQPYFAGGNEQCFDGQITIGYVGSNGGGGGQSRVFRSRPDCGTTDVYYGTSSSGYFFEDVEIASWDVYINTPAGWSLTTPDRWRNLQIPPSRNGLDFGLKPIPTPTPTRAPQPSDPIFRFQGIIFNDNNRNGQKDQGENCYNGEVNLFGGYAIGGSEPLPEHGNPFVSQQNCNGYISNWFGPNQTYAVSLQIPMGWFPTTPIRVVRTIPPYDVNINFGLTDSVPWWQTKIGDVRAGTGGLTDRIPNIQGRYRYVSIKSDRFSTNCDDDGCSYIDGSPGIVSYKDSADFGYGASSEKEWKVDSGYSGGSYGYEFANSQIASPQVFDGNNPPTVSGYYKANGEVTISPKTRWVDDSTYGEDTSYQTPFDWEIPQNQKIVVLIDGNLTIKRKISVPTGSFLAFYVKGDIIIDSSIGGNPNNENPHLAGVFISDGSFKTQSTQAPSPGNNRLNIAGTVVVDADLNGQGNLVQERDLGSQNKDSAAFYVLYRPDFILSAPSLLQKSNFSWQEIAP